jgi:hypothetical protein
MNCELLANCGFFKKYAERYNLSCKGFIKLYCQGPRRNECQRKQCGQEHGEPLSDDMMPNGQILVERGASKEDTVY